MSYEAVKWALRDAPDLPGQLVAVLVGLAEHASKDGTGTYPSVETLADYARKSKRQIQYDLKQLTDLDLIRPGDQRLTKDLPPNRRPVVYNLAMERTKPSGVQPSGAQSIAPQAGPAAQPTAPQEVPSVGVVADSPAQSTAPQPPAEAQPLAGQQPIAPVQSTAPLGVPDQGEYSGMQPIAPQGPRFLGCNGASPGVQPTADKPPLNLPVVELVTQGGSGGDSATGRRNPRRPRRDLNAGRDDVERLCQHLAERIAANGYEDPKVTKEWRDDARLMLDVDGHREDQVHKAIDWCQGNGFWRKNIRSMPKLREQYVRLQMEADDERKGLPPERRDSANGHRVGKLDRGRALVSTAARMDAEQAAALAASNTERRYA